MSGPVLLDFYAEEIAKRRERRASAKHRLETSKPRQIVVLDSNALYTQHKEHIFSAEALAQIAECRKYVSLRVLIPRVSFLERLYQKNYETVTRFDKAQAELGSLSNLVRYGLQNYDGPSDVRRFLYRRALNWCEENAITLIRTPVKTINWNCVIRDAIWRVPPFSPYDPNAQKRTEKGFKDAMILATVSTIIAGRDESQIAFVSNDDLLRETAKEKHRKNTNFAAYPSLTELLSALQIEHKEVSLFLARMLVEKAPAIFYDPANPDCLYTAHDLPRKIASDFSLRMNYLFQTSQDFSGYLKEAAASTAEKIKVGSTAFKMIDESGRYHWQTEMIFVRGFKANENEGDVMRGASFEVDWICNFAEDGTYSGVLLDNIVCTYTLLVSLASQNMTSYNIEQETDLFVERFRLDVAQFLSEAKAKKESKE